jgi:hypothetical protein
MRMDEAEALRQFREARQDTDRAEALLRLIAVLLRNGNSPPPASASRRGGPTQVHYHENPLIGAAGPGGDPPVIAVRNGPILVRDKSTGHYKLLHPGERLLEGGALSPSDDEENEHGAARAERVTRILDELQEGRSTAELERARRETIAKADRSIDRGGVAERDTAKRDRREALRDLSALREIRDKRARSARRMNTAYNFQSLLGSDVGPEHPLRGFRQARFALDDHLNITLIGFRPDAIESIDVAFRRQGKTLFRISGDGRRLVLVDPVSASWNAPLELMRNEDGSCYMVTGRSYGRNAEWNWGAF